MSWLEQAEALASERKFEDAVECYDRAIQFDAADARAWLGKAETLVRTGRIEEALPCFDVAIKLDPSSARGKTEALAAVWMMKGRAEEALGLRVDALASFRRVVDLAETPGLLAAAWQRIRSITAA